MVSLFCHESIENQLRVHLKATCTSLAYDARDVNFVVTCKLTKFVFGNESKQGYKEALQEFKTRANLKSHMWRKTNLKQSNPILPFLACLLLGFQGLNLGIKKQAEKM